jgi:cell division protein FtsL
MNQAVRVLTNFKPVEYVFIIIVFLIVGGFVNTSASAKTTADTSTNYKINDQIYQDKNYIQGRKDIIKYKYEVYDDSKYRKLYNIATKPFKNYTNPTENHYIVIENKGSCGTINTYLSKLFEILIVEPISLNQLCI